ncbi:hypothetical protein ES707_07556 [subsurface metagenome]
MNFFYEVSIPSGREQILPFEQVLPLSYGIISRMEITIPSGAGGKSHLQLFYHDFQLYPLSRGEDYHGDDSVISFSDTFFMESSPFQLKARGWNTDTHYKHAFLVSIEVLKPEQLPADTTVLGIGDLSELIGTGFEV